MDHFYIRASDGKRGAWCLVCHNQETFENSEELKEWFPRARAIQQLGIYKLSREEYKYLKAFEQRGCFICGKHNRKRSLNIDHDHATGRVRGLLCTSCNIKLGKWRDNPPAHETKFHSYLSQ
jgi:hypothetical protein